MHTKTYETEGVYSAGALHRQVHPRRSPLEAPLPDPSTSWQGSDRSMKTTPPSSMGRNRGRSEDYLELCRNVPFSVNASTERRRRKEGGRRPESTRARSESSRVFFFFREYETTDGRPAMRCCGVPVGSLLTNRNRNEGRKNEKGGQKLPKPSPQPNTDG